MKALYLNDILNQIGDFSVSDEENFIVTNVETYPEYLKENMVLFYIDKKKELLYDSYKSFKSFAVIMETSGEETLEMKDNHIVVKVKDVESSYWNFVKYYRSLFNIPVYAVTGTCGKSTTKEMLRHILSDNGKIQATRGSANSNRLNLDYLLGIDDETKAAVFELGVMFSGDILDYCKYFKPTIGIITNIGVDHLRWIDTFEYYIKAKEEILEGLSYKGTLILNADDENISKIDLTEYQGDIIYFGKSDKSDFKISNISYGNGGMDFLLKHGKNIYKLFISQYGEHNVYNSAAAIAGAYVSGISIENAGECLKNFNPMPHHLQVSKGINSCLLLDDTWTSNYMSVNATLKVLDALGKDKRKFAVFGRMSSMIGAASKDQYKQIGKELASQNIDILITRGEDARLIAESALYYGMSQDKIFTTCNTESIINILKNLADENTIVSISACWGDKFTDLLEKIL